MAPAFQTTPFVGQNADERLEIFVVGTDQALYDKWQTTVNGGWSDGWANFGGSWLGKPAVGQNADGRLEIFVVGTDHALYDRWQTAPNNGWFGGWADISPPPMDLVWDSADDNGLPLNPRWRYQMITGSVPEPPTLCSSLAACTSQQTSTDSASICRLNPDGYWQVPGHWNWFPVTLEGSISWHSHSSWDDDYKFEFHPPDNAGFTVSAASKGYMELEFDSDETIDHFSTPWWESFHNAVDNSAGAAATLQEIRSGGLFATEEIVRLLEQEVEYVYQMIEGRFAIVTGLFGLDCAHSDTDSSTELHPVYAMTILVNDNPADQLWAIFARNWGDEGFCSTSQHYLDLLNLTEERL
jgi:hypothetical protein